MAKRDMGNIKMIVTDLDRTLLREDSMVSERAASALRICRARGRLIVFATARPERATHGLGASGIASYIIANNGATIMAGKRVLRNITFPRETRDRLLARVLAEKAILSLTVEVGDRLFTNDRTVDLWAGREVWNAIPTDFSAPIEGDVPKISIECRDSQVVQALVRDFPEARLLPNSGEDWFQVVPAGASKWSALEFLCKRLETSVRDVMAFGDDHNDVEMLGKCGVGVAVENAIVEAKRAAKFACESHENDGVARFLEKNLLLSSISM